MISTSRSKPTVGSQPSTARALAAEPQILLLDDPLRNVDAKLRFEMRLELPRLDGGHNHIAHMGVATVGAEHADALDPFGAAVVGHREKGFLLNHDG